MPVTNPTRYVSAAATLSRLAEGDPNASPTHTTYRAPRDWQSGNHIDGQPLGTRGGFQVEHVFPLDAEYEFRMAARADDEVQITINGKRAALLPSTGPRGALSRTGRVDRPR